MVTLRPLSPDDAPALTRMEAMHHPDNPASGRVLTKTGFTRTGTCDRYADDGTFAAYQVYALPKPQDDVLDLVD
ncbi:GNAT family N-acetyltransferase [Streptomyces sp. NRRL S-1448]|uniref:GNAT family N-acetyltransferase n=1 Tax=Streptomyces sp. NRRL S-1448 TaxID=1463883 RepID=UPI0004C1D670|nr:GNAT family protein [Streptomyces sp. NRRL S-1448]